MKMVIMLQCNVRRKIDIAGVLTKVEIQRKEAVRRDLQIAQNQLTKVD